MSLPPPPPSTSPAWVPEPTVAVTQVSKWFGQKVAVSDLSCAFGPGVTGLLGPNGAGKTTLLRMMCGLLGPSSGELRVLGRDPHKDPKVFRALALVPEEDAVYGVMTGRAFVRYAAVLSGKGADRVDAAIAEVDLEDAADRPISGYSKGMRQRAKVAAALVTEPEILVLDEPLNGTDPVQRAHLIEVFRALGAAGHTVIVSSHVLAEVERMADRVLAIVDGKLAAAGDVTAIRRAMADIPYRVRIECDRPRELASRLVTLESVNGLELFEQALEVETSDLATLGRTVPAAAADLGARLTGFLPDESLDVVFRYLVGRR